MSPARYLCAMPVKWVLLCDSVAVSVKLRIVTTSWGF